MDEIRIFREYIRYRGLRNTPEREAIIEEIFSSHEHFDVDELFLRLKNKKKRISKASIYRTIPLLIDSGLIKEVYFEDGHLHYEHIYGHKHHSHFRCTCCGRIYEFSDDEVVRLRYRIGEKHGFVITSHRLELLGYCPGCSQQHDGRNSGRSRHRDGWPSG